MNVHRLDSTDRLREDAAVTSAVEQILKRLEGLERRIARLEAAAGIGRASIRASNADAFRAGSPGAPAHSSPVPASSAVRPSVVEQASAATGPAAMDAAVTQRLDRVPGRDADPFPDLSQLEEKLEPKKGPAQQVQVRAALEDHPRISNRIQQLWGTPDCEDYLNSLVIDTRGNRKGFPPAMLEELLYLGRLARALVILGVDGDLWESYDQIGDRR
jgi:hypothetical protein